MATETLTLEIIGQDHASAEIKNVQKSLEELDKETRELGKSILKSFSGIENPLKKLEALAQSFGAQMAEGAERIKSALLGDVTAANELQEALKRVAETQKSIARGYGPSTGSSPLQGAARQAEATVARQARAQAATDRAAAAAAKRDHAGRMLALKTRFHIMEYDWKAQDTAEKQQAQRREASASRIEKARKRSHDVWMAGVKSGFSTLNSGWAEQDAAEKHRETLRAAVQRGAEAGQRRVHNAWMTDIKSRFSAMSHEWQAEYNRHTIRLKHQRELRSEIAKSSRGALGHAGHAIRSLV